MTRQILITGANGFVGRHLVRRLSEALPEAALLQTSRLGGSGNQALDITDAGAVFSLLDEIRPYAVVHLAAMAFVPSCEEDPAAAYNINLVGTLNLARAVMNYVPECRFIFAGSSEIYGGSFRANVLLDEKALLEPLNVYAATKAAADLLLGQYAHRGLLVTRFRPFNHFGPGQSDRFVLASFARQIVSAELGEGSCVLKTGDLSSMRDFLDVRDIVDAYVAAIGRPEALPAGTILNLASGRPRRISDVLKQMIGLSDLDLTTEQSGDRLRATDIPIAGGDAGRALELLDWYPRKQFSQSLVDLLNWQRNSRTIESATPDP